MNKQNIISPTSEAMDSTPLSTNLYLLQVDNNTNSQFVETIPLHLLINNVQQTKSEHLILPFIENKLSEGQRQLQLCIDPKVLQHSNSQSSQKHGQLSNLPTKSNKDFTRSTKPLSIEVGSIITNKAVENKSLNRRHGSGPVVLENIVKERNQMIQNYVHISDRVVPPKAVAVLPTALQIRLNCISSRRTLPARTRFGPVRGVINKLFIAEVHELVVEASTANIPIFLCKRNSESVCQINMSDHDRCNWIGLLPLGSQTTANVWMYEEDDELYGITTKSVPSRTPLMIGYSKKYAEDHNIPAGQPILDIHEDPLPVASKRKCSEYHPTMDSHHQRQLKVSHKDAKSRTPRYRCSQCTRTFSRLFTLNRHKSRICTVKLEKVDNPITSSIINVNKGIGICSAPNVDESRVPSDESFQNYSQILDLSTNLFDTDRIPNLDISGSSRSENEFNPFAIGYRDDNSLAQDAGYSSNAAALINSKIDNKSQNKVYEKIMVPCPYCELSVAKEKYRQHFRECPKRRCECKCGQVFNNKLRMAEHIHKHHADDLKPSVANETVIQPTTDAQYRCEECKHNFKRRGMLVNHMWRVHKRAAAVPLERRERRYPCGACPKLYRAAAKRDRHVRAHHPGETTRAAPIEGERRTLVPASCPVCPRQYGTRAKLLQHLRSHHPHVSVPHKNKTPLKLQSKRKSKTTTPAAAKNL